MPIPRIGRITVWIASLLAALSIQPTQAGEGGGSIYLQGTYNDFLMAIVGPAGFYFRDDLFRYSGTVGARPLGGQIQPGSSEVAWVDGLKFAYVSDLKILGGTYSAGIAIPIVLNVGVSGSGAILQSGASRLLTGNIGGLGDAFLISLQLNWTAGDHHFGFAADVSAPTGRYDKDRLLNTGRNYWAFDPNVSYTWLDPNGHEFDFDAGMLSIREIRRRTIKLERSFTSTGTWRSTSPAALRSDS